MIPWTIKYVPASTAGIAGQDAAIAFLKKFTQGFRGQRKRALMLYGPSGCGKTCAVYALSKEMGYEILEVNASDFRNEAKLNASVVQASKQQSLFGKSKILLVDEIEGIFSTLDRGAVPVLVKLAKESAFPIIFTANDPWDKKFSPLRAVCEMLEFKRPDHQTTLGVLRRVCDGEGVRYEERALTTLARRAGGDIRGAIIDLQTLTDNGRFGTEQLSLLGDRHRTETIFNALLRVFKTTDAFVARMAFENVDENIDTLFLWIDENLPKEYTSPADLARAYEKLSRADVFRGRIIRKQEWHFLATISILLSAGIALSKERKYETFVRYGPTQRLLTMWRAKQRNLQRASIAEKVARKTHCSVKAAVQNTVPYLRKIFKYGGDKGVIDYLDLNSEEVAWLSRA